MTFDYGLIPFEQANTELLEYMRKGCYQDPFGAPDDNLEADIIVEKQDIEREKKKLLKSLKQNKKILNDQTQELLSPTSPGNRRPSRSFDIGSVADREDEVHLSGQEGQSKGGQKKLHRHQTERESNGHMKIIFKDSVALIDKGQDTLEEAMMSNIKRLTAASSKMLDPQEPSDSGSFRKSQLLIDEIDQEYDRFEAIPIDVSVQTIPEIVASI